MAYARIQAPGTMGQALAIPSLLTSAQGLVNPVQDALHSVESIFTGNPYAGGADPCCPPGYNPPKPWPTNSGIDGAPPDYRTKGSPMTDTSSLGHGRNKDRFCDCLPFKYGTEYWILGYVTPTGQVKTGPLTADERPKAVWVAVDASGKVLRVPGVGVASTTTSSPSLEPQTGQTTVTQKTAATASSGTAKLVVGGLGLALLAARHIL